MVFKPLADWEVWLLSMGMVKEEVDGCCVVVGLLSREVIGQQDRHDVASYTKTGQAPS